MRSPPVGYGLRLFNMQLYLNGKNICKEDSKIEFLPNI